MLKTVDDGESGMGKSLQEKRDCQLYGEDISRENETTKMYTKLYIL